LKPKLIPYKGEPIVTADGGNLIPKHICKLEFKIAQRKFEHTFIVLKDSPWKLILGAEFIQKADILMDIPQAMFWFRNQPNEACKFIKFRNHEFLCALQGLSELQNQELNNLISEYPEVFTDKIGCTDLIPCKLEVEGPPIAMRPYPISQVKRKIMKEHVQEMLRLGIIEPSDSEWSFPATLHMKGEGPPRFVMDYRKLNFRLKSDPYSFNRMDSILHRLGEAQFLTVIDLKKGFWQLLLHPDSRKYCTFVCDEGKFSFTRLNFGLKTAPALFSRLVSKVLGEARGLFADAYLDDIIIFSKSWKEHLEHIKFVLQKLKKAGLTVNPAKCQFGKTTIKYLGFIVSPAGVQIDRDKLAPLLDYPRPRTVKENRRFLGLCGWYRNFINKFSDIAEPLNRLLKKSVTFSWQEEQQEAFDKLKKSIVDSAILAFPNFNEKFIVRTDASEVGVSGILAQKVNGFERPIAFASRSLSKTEKSYHASEIECCAILFSLKKFEQYLEGQEFTLETDNQALLWLHSMRDVNSKFLRWSLRIQDFQANISHCPGRLNVVADALSRAPTGDSEDVEETCREIPQINCSMPSILCAITSKITLNTVRDEQAKDPEIQALLTDLPPDFIIKDNLLYKQGKYGGKMPVIPKSLRYAILEYFHDRPEAGHFGFRKTMHRLMRRVFWFHMQEDIYEYIQSCQTCQFTKNPTSKPSGQMKSIKTHGPWDILAVDLMGPFPMTQRKNTQLLVAVDHFSKWVELFALPKATTYSVARKLEQEVFCRWGAPRCLLSDNGKSFTSHIMKNVCKTWGIQQKFTTFYHPQANITERINKNIGAIMRTYVARRHSKWDEFLPEVALALRTAISDTTGFSPCMLNFGREIPTLLDRRLEDEDEGEFQSRIEHKNLLISRLEDVYTQARINIDKAQAQQTKYYDRRHKKSVFVVGDLLCLRTHFKSDKSRKIMKKLCHRWSGPYEVIEVVTPLTYRIIERDSRQDAGVHNVKNLKRYYDRPIDIQTDSSSHDSQPQVVQPVVSNYNLRSKVRNAQ